MVGFLVHHVVSRMLDVDRLEGAGPNVQDDICTPDALFIESREQVRGEVQAGGRRGDRSALFRVDRLVAFSVCGLVDTRDVRREWNVAVFLDRFVRDESRRQSYDAGAAFGRRHDLDLEVVGDSDDATRLELAAGMHHRFPGAIAQIAQQQDLGGRTVIA
jgi:hypothetical protein